MPGKLKTNCLSMKYDIISLFLSAQNISRMEFMNDFRILFDFFFPFCEKLERENEVREDFAGALCLSFV